MFEMVKGGIDPLSVKQLADHHSLKMTDIYTNHVDPNLQKIIVENSPKFVKN
jgi:site-specific recombinase XerD